MEVRTEMVSISPADSQGFSGSEARNVEVLDCVVKLWKAAVYMCHEGCGRETTPGKNRCPASHHASFANIDDKGVTNSG